MQSLFVGTVDPDPFGGTGNQDGETSKDKRLEKEDDNAAETEEDEEDEESADVDEAARQNGST